MALILNIETSTKNCSVTLAKDGVIVKAKEINTGNYSHAEMLHPFISEVFNNSSYLLSDLEAVAVGKGPGSYTGLRIGVSAAKGICFSLDIPLIAINSLQILANQVKTDNGIIIPLIDARRMEVYAAVFDKNIENIRETKAEIINENSFQNFTKENKTFVLGDGAEKCKNIIHGKELIFLDNCHPSANDMTSISEQKYHSKDFEDVAYFEPFYLKDFLVNPEKKKV